MSEEHQLNDWLFLRRPASHFRELQQSWSVWSTILDVLFNHWLYIKMNNSSAKLSMRFITFAWSIKKIESVYAKANRLLVSSFIFSIQTSEWYQTSHHVVRVFRGYLLWVLVLPHLSLPAVQLRLWVPDSPKDSHRFRLSLYFFFFLLLRNPTKIPKPTTCKHPGHKYKASLKKRLNTHLVH